MPYFPFSISFRVNLSVCFYFVIFVVVDVNGPVIEYACSNKGQLKIIVNSHPFNRTSANDNKIYWTCRQYCKTRYVRLSLTLLDICNYISISLSLELQPKFDDIIIFFVALFSDVQHEFKPMSIHKILILSILNTTMNDRSLKSLKYDENYNT